MKLRTRLIISFFIIIVVPVLLAGATVWGFGQHQMKAIRQIYKMDGNAYDYFVNSFKVLSHFTKSTYEKLQKVAKEAPEKLEDQAYLDEINRELDGKYSYLIVRQEDKLVYEGSKEAEDSLRENLPEYDSDVLQSAGSGFYMEGEEQALIKQIDFSFTNGSKGSVFIITSMERLLPDIKGILLDMMISIFLIFIFASTERDPAGMIFCNLCLLSSEFSTALISKGWLQFFTSLHLTLLNGIYNVNSFL